MDDANGFTAGKIKDDHKTHEHSVSRRWDAFGDAPFSIAHCVHDAGSQPDGRNACRAVDGCSSLEQMLMQLVPWCRKADPWRTQRVAAAKVSVRPLGDREAILNGQQPLDLAIAQNQHRNLQPCRKRLPPASPTFRSGV